MDIVIRLPNDDITQHGCGWVEVVVISAVTLSQQRLLRCWEMSQFRSSSLRRVYDDYYFYVGLGFEELSACSL